MYVFSSQLNMAWTRNPRILIIDVDVDVFAPVDLRHPIVTTLVHTHAALLLPLFHALWVTEGRGNANFYYAASLVMGVAGGMGVVDACFAGLRIAFGDIAEGERDKWTVVQE